MHCKCSILKREMYDIQLFIPFSLNSSLWISDMCLQTKGTNATVPSNLLSKAKGVNVPWRTRLIVCHLVDWLLRKKSSLWPHLWLSLLPWDSLGLYNCSVQCSYPLLHLSQKVFVLDDDDFALVSGLRPLHGCRFTESNLHFICCRVGDVRLLGCHKWAPAQNFQQH